MIQQSHFWYIQKIEIRISNRYVQSVYCIIIHNSQDIETTYPQISIHRWMDKENAVHPRVKYYSALKKGGNSAKHIMNEFGEHYAK